MQEKPNAHLSNSSSPHSVEISEFQIWSFQGLKKANFAVFEALDLSFGPFQPSKNAQIHLKS